MSGMDRLTEAELIAYMGRHGRYYAGDTTLAARELLAHRRELLAHRRAKRSITNRAFYLAGSKYENGQHSIVKFDPNGTTHIDMDDLVVMSRSEYARRASQAAPAPSDGLREAAQWVNAAMVAIRGYERDLGVPMDDECEIGRIDDSRDSPSFRIRVGHIRRIAQALSASPAQEGGE